ncbi:transcription termination factor NusA [Nitrospina watsonii]|uniref:Transcription termination/antitermination protein NusA n=1 Tax=Nitrospina watsonii TaxID=1323948 RepID=A0ABM9HCP0_9BACT|nr:transcription termination factor NusA [Nitrospina watsonii]CAI2717924.1 Transcription termination protein NusA [Nitrospina watsonii]
MTVEVIHILDQLCREKGIDRDVLIDALKSAVEAAVRKKLPDIETLQSRFNEETGEVEILTERTVVAKVTDPETEITKKQAVKQIPDAEIGDVVLVKRELEDLGRIAAQLAKQVILQKVREAEIEILYNEFIDKKGDLINGLVQRFEHGDIVVDLGKAEGILPRREQVFRESFNRGDRVRAYVLDVRKTAKNTLVILSRTHVGLIKRLFELEVPEISEGMVEIMGIVREPNGRTKIAVRTNDRDIDAVGACVGMRGMRVQSIVQELRGEKIDIVEFSEDPEVFIRNALSPAKISRILMNKDEKQMTIIVADDQMSLAIGKKGQNVRLAAKLVKWKIDIKGESESGGVLETPGLFQTSDTPREDFFDILKNTKGFGEKIVSILFNDNIVSFDEVVKRGVAGMQELPGIGPKKAESLVEFSQEHIDKRVPVAPAPKKPAPTPPPVDAQEENNTLIYTSPSLKKTALDTTAPEFQADAAEPGTSEGEEEEPVAATEDADAVTEDVSAEDAGGGEDEEEEEEQELGLEALAGVAPSIIDALASNGFQTIAELSVSAVEELTAIDAIEEETAQAIITQAKLLMEKYENV